MQRWWRLLATALVLVGGLLAQGGYPAWAQRPFPQLTPAPESRYPFPLHHGPMPVPRVPASATRGPAPTPPPSPTVADAWSPNIRLRGADDWLLSPVHGALLPDGSVVLFGMEATTEFESPTRRSRPGALLLRPNRPEGPFPSDVAGQPLREPRDYFETRWGDWLLVDTLLCAGQTLTSDGKLFTAGGTRIYFPLNNQPAPLTGLPFATLFNGRDWWRVPADMQVTANVSAPYRWYPTTTRLPDTRILVVGGFDVIVPTYMGNPGAEIYDPAKGTWQVVSPSAKTPTSILNELYTHTFVLPNVRGGRSLLLFGEDGLPNFMSLAGSAQWEQATRPRPGAEAYLQARSGIAGSSRPTWLTDLAPNRGATSAMLPIRLWENEWGYANGSVIMAGGIAGTSHMHHVDVYDPMADAWRPRLDAHLARVHPAAVLLPDSRVLLVAGVGPEQPVRQAQYVDPRAGFALATGASTGGVTRGYHTVALLLPDGRVLVAGGLPALEGDPSGQPTMQYYYPPYLFGPRPTITAAPAEFALDTPFTVETGGDGAPVEAILMGLGAMTHSFDMNQRAVQLEISAVQSLTKDTYRATLRSPRTAEIASPGYYMLFILNAQRIPSEAKIVRLLGPGSPLPAQVDR